MKSEGGAVVWLAMQHTVALRMDGQKSQVVSKVIVVIIKEANFVEKKTEGDDSAVVQDDHRGLLRGGQFLGGVREETVPSCSFSVQSSWMESGRGASA